MPGDIDGVYQSGCAFDKFALNFRDFSIDDVTTRIRRISGASESSFLGDDLRRYSSVYECHRQEYIVSQVERIKLSEVVRRDDRYRALSGPAPANPFPGSLCEGL